MFDVLLARVFEWAAGNAWWIIILGLALGAVGGAARSGVSTRSSDHDAIRKSKEELIALQKAKRESDVTNSGFPL